MTETSTTCACGSDAHSRGVDIVLNSEQTHVFPARLLTDDDEGWDE